LIVQLQKGVEEVDERVDRVGRDADTAISKLDKQLDITAACAPMWRIENSSSGSPC
jgi:hypothetical protein